jgi:hypothetical protein
MIIGRARPEILRPKITANTMPVRKRRVSPTPKAIFLIWKEPDFDLD